MIEVYSKEGCPLCSKVIRLLELAELNHVEYKLGREFNANKFRELFGTASTFPRVVKDNILIGGCTETVNFIKENNLL